MPLFCINLKLLASHYGLMIFTPREKDHEPLRWQWAVESSKQTKKDHHGRGRTWPEKTSYRQFRENQKTAREGRNACQFSSPCKESPEGRQTSSSTMQTHARSLYTTYCSWWHISWAISSVIAYRSVGEELAPHATREKKRRTNNRSQRKETSNEWVKIKCVSVTDSDGQNWFICYNIMPHDLVLPV